MCLTHPAAAVTKRGMRCFHVMVHGRMDTAGPERKQSQATPFFVNRWVLASNDEAAASRAFASVRRELKRKGFDPDEVALEVEEISVASWATILQPKQGFVFYEDEDDVR
jgi:hypothetical protein